MRIHSDTLTASDIYQTVADLPGVYVEVMPHGSRARKQAFEVRVTGTSSRRTMDNQDQAATWDEWGVFFARLFNQDVHALAGSAKHPNYNGSKDFHTQTGHRFAALAIPADTHQQHRWEFDGRTLACSKCSATLNRR
ncbi:hypothetical protein SEA_A3WALLY_389 [Microbacterium phage A3Wally]|nr:hypothetical protein SEA_A3WALLY_36 [Microbacterium phage A3Wally]QWY84196.1 hypothetical protein SEA_A3WALLY_389 [Microbacterium phage A3Wally]